ncbi:MAG: zinc-ribbon domain-containing protein [Polyangiaceae bacterium]
MITCPKCTKENQDHYKFCLGCGAELPRDASPKKFAPGTPPHGVPAVRPGIADESTSQGAGGGARASNQRPGQPGMAMGGGGPGLQPSFQPPPMTTGPPPPPAGGGGSVSPGAGGAPPVICPQCEHPNPSSNKFCASCGFKLARSQACSRRPPPPRRPRRAAGWCSPRCAPTARRPAPGRCRPAS